MQPAPILLTGVRGQVGGDLLPLLQRFGNVVAPTSDELDLRDERAVRHFVRELAPRLIVNPAAYTAVDKAESEPELARALNAVAPGVLGEEGARLGSPVLHFSTDYVFAGNGTQPWREDSPTGPLGVYGATKLAGEQALAASGAAYMIFRTSWVYGARGKNFLRTILKLAREREELRIVGDQHGAPTWSEDLARLVKHVVEGCQQASAREGSTLAECIRARGGIYHAVNAGETTWAGFAEEIVRLAKLAEPEQRFARIVAIPTSEYPTPARRPANSRLDASKMGEQLGFTMPAWQESAAKVMVALAPAVV